MRVPATLRRYVLAELVGTAAACAAVWLAYRMTDSSYAAGLSGSLCENVGYYATIVVVDARRQRRPRAVLHSLPGLLVEFGPAEVIDSLFMRPLLMAVGPLVTGAPAAGALAGKVVADLLFYVVVVPAGRLRRRPSAP